MPLGNDAPQFFCSAIEGVSQEGPNLVLSFSTPIPSADQKTRTYVTNVRIAMSIDSTKQMVDFLQKYFSNQQPNVGISHEMPELPQ